MNLHLPALPERVVLGPCRDDCGTNFSSFTMSTTDALMQKKGIADYN